MISTLAYKAKLETKKTAGLTRFSGMRGRVLTGFGGDLAGYNQNLQQNRAALEDQLVQKKYERGEISFEELLLHLTKAANRQWVSPEEKRILLSNVQDLKIKYEDEKIANEYRSGRIKARDVANYQRQKLSTMLPGTPVYENQLSEIAKWEKESRIDVAKNFAAREDARLASISDPEKLYDERSSVYNSVANMYRAAGDELTAFQYEEAANKALVDKQSFQEKKLATDTETKKSELVGLINTAYNDYHDGTINAQDFLAKLDLYERNAITNQFTDLLDDMNKLTDYVREDVVYGKDWMRGGTRIKGPGVGTGGSYTDPITGETIGGDGMSSSGGGGVLNTTGISSGTTGSVSTSTSTPQKERQTWEQQDASFKENVESLQKDVIEGKISKEIYLNGMKLVISSRKGDLDQRITDIQNSGLSKVIYEGKKTKY